MQRMLEDLRCTRFDRCDARGFSVTVVATLALGIGVASAAISLLHALVLRPLDVSDPEGLVAISRRSARACKSDPAPPRSRSRGANHSSP